MSKSFTARTEKHDISKRSNSDGYKRGGYSIPAKSTAKSYEVLCEKALEKALLSEEE